MEDPREFRDYSDSPTNNGWIDSDWPPYPYNQRGQEYEDDNDDGEDENIPDEDERDD